MRSHSNLLTATHVLVAFALLTIVPPQAVLAVDTNVLLVTSHNNGNILRYDALTGNYLGVFIPGGTATLSHPEGMAIGPDGAFYVSSSQGANPNAILRFNLATGQPIGTGIFATGFGTLGIPRGIVFDANSNLLVANDQTEVRQYAGNTGQFLGAFVSGNLSRADVPKFGPDGALYVTDRSANRIQRFNGTTGQFLNTFISGGALDKPEDIVWGPDGLVYVSSSNTDSVLRYTAAGQFLGTFVPSGSGGLDIPSSIMFGPDGNLLVTSYATSRILRYNGSTGAFLGAFEVTADLSGPTYLIMVPEPSTVLFGILGAIVAFGRRGFAVRSA